MRKSLAKYPFRLFTTSLKWKWQKIVKIGCPLNSKMIFFARIIKASMIWLVGVKIANLVKTRGLKTFWIPGPIASKIGKFCKLLHGGARNPKCFETSSFHQSASF